MQKVLQESKKVFLGVSTSRVVKNNAQIGSPAYKAGLNSVNSILSNYEIGDTTMIQFSRYNQLRTVKLL